MKLLVPLLLMVMALGVIALPVRRTESASPGQTVAPLLSCANVDASADNKVLVGDILAVVQAYFKDYPSTNYVFMYDLAGPYNPQTGLGGQQRVDDILAVVNQYFDVCPVVDTQVAAATRWILVERPELRSEDATALAAAGYSGLASVDVPGQGVHYGRLDAGGGLGTWDNVFDPTDPEGLVYNDGRLVAQLYLVDGADVGWVPEDPGPNQGSCVDGVDNGGDTVADAADSDCILGSPSGSPPDDVDIDPFAYCSVDGNGDPIPCSWDGTEGWHLHYHLCLAHIGTPSAFFNFAADHAACKSIQSQSPCQGSGCPGTMYYGDRIGWMGHLWNWLPNANRVPDVNGSMNGRFADCFPDTQGWKAYNCPQ